jgi:hypothetical protein
MKRWISSLFILFSSIAMGDVITLYVPIISESPKLHLYYHQLLKVALEESGHKPNLIPVTVPQSRMLRLMDEGRISIYWALASKPANEKYHPIPIDLTDGLIGKRILLIKDGQQSRYDEVKSLHDFRQLELVAGMGQGWYDIKVWQANDLNYKVASGNWSSIFRMIPYGRKYDYISRGMTEVLADKEHHPKLQIENNLLLTYAQDTRFFLSKEGKNAGVKYHQIIESSLNKAKQSGLISRMIEQFWGDDIEQLDVKNRIEIHLTSP